jgi:purine-nucleoside phosphorylase
MVDYADNLFGRKLPENVLIRAGAHLADRAEKTLSIFDEVDRFHGSWTPYCFAWKDDVEFLVIFNVYGAALTLEVMRLIHQGGAQNVSFVGSAFSKTDEIGQQLLVTAIYDQAGIVRMDGVEKIVREEQELNYQRKILENNNSQFSEVLLCSVPSVMHNIENVKTFVNREEVDAVEMELSTFFYFGKQQKMKTSAYVYTSDNPHNSLIAKDTKRIRYEAMTLSSKMAIEHLLTY